jgi:PilZ domain
MDSFPPANDRNDAKRRSQRVMLKTPVVMMVRGNDGKMNSEETRTTTVNAHGAMVLLKQKVAVGQLVRLCNSSTGEEAICRVVYVSPHQAEQREVGLDFMEPLPQFWRVSFPPTDWTPRSPEAKSSAKRPETTLVDATKRKS